MIASMALKFRSNKKQKQRIIVFIASPLTDADVVAMPEIAKSLKKSLVGLDIVSLIESNKDILTKFVEQVNVSDNSHFLQCNSNMPIADFILQSPIAEGTNNPGQANMVSNMQDDPEMMEAIRLSLEEGKKKEEKSKEPTATKEEPMIEEMTEEEMMKKALEMSIQLPQPMTDIKIPSESSESDKLINDPEYLRKAIEKVTHVELTKEEVIVNY